MTPRHPRRTDFASSSFPKPPTSRMYRNIAVTFLGLTVVIMIIAIWMSSVHAQIIVKAKPSVATLDTFVDIAKNPEPGQLPGRVVEGPFDLIQEFKVKDQAQQPVMAEPVVATTTGRVRITNGYSQDQTLIKTTRLLAADGKLFRINATVNVPSGSFVEVAAYSDVPGVGSLIPSKTRFTIPGLWVDLQKWIYAEALTDFTGSKESVSNRRTVSAQDLTDAQKSLEQMVMDKAKNTLLAEAGISEDKTREDCPDDQGCWQAVYLVKPIEKKSNVVAGQEAESFLAQVKLQVTAVFYPKKDMEMLVRSKLKERLPDGRDIVRLDADRVTYTVQQSDKSTEKARIGIRADADARLTPSSPSLSTENLFGLSPQEARSKLLTLDGVESVQIIMQPSWARKIPAQKSKIEVTVQ